MGAYQVLTGLSQDSQDYDYSRINLDSRPNMSLAWSRNEHGKPRQKVNFLF
jgi:hypothetical protein